MKVLIKKVQCSSLSSIHVLYNQTLVGGVSCTLTPARWIANVKVNGGSNEFCDLPTEMGKGNK